MKEKITLTTLEEIKAFSDPFRYKILMCFYRNKKPATVKEIAVALNEVPANVHYHVKKLEKVGILELVYTKEINNIIAKYYQPTAENFDISYSSELAEPCKKLMLAQNVQLLTQIYDDSKNTFISSIDTAKNKGTISMEDLYLTEDEALALQDYIKDFMTKHANKDRNADHLKKYHTFFSIIGIKEL